MLATLAGSLALLLGLAILLLPLLAGELSRPRDSAWGAVVLLMGLVLVTSADRLTGAPMLGVLCAGLVIGRLGSEVGQARWRQLTPEEQLRLWSAERWRSSLNQLSAALGRLLALGSASLATVLAWVAERRRPRSSGKRWIRPEAAAETPAQEEAPEARQAAAPEPAPEPAPEAATAEPAPLHPVEAADGADGQENDDRCREVADFAAIDSLLKASEPGEPRDEAG